MYIKIDVSIKYNQRMLSFQMQDVSIQTNTCGNVGGFYYIHATYDYYHKINMVS